MNVSSGPVIVMRKKLDVRKHVLVPQHRKLSEKEKQAVLERYHATLENMPKISKKDPVVLSIGAKPGDLVEIRRKSLTAGEALFYRVVVNV